MNHPGDASTDSLEAANKALARGFYEDLWFTNNTDRYADYVADEYVVHDVGDRKGVTESAIEQKRIADFFHSRGNMTGSIDYQIAEGDMVATRWQWKMEPTSLMFKIMGGSNQIPIINVFRFENGKIVEIWNHRHDIDTGRALPVCKRPGYRPSRGPDRVGMGDRPVAQKTARLTTQSL